MRELSTIENEDSKAITKYQNDFKIKKEVAIDAVDEDIIKTERVKTVVHEFLIKRKKNSDDHGTINNATTNDDDQICKTSSVASNNKANNLVMLNLNLTGKPKEAQREELQSLSKGIKEGISKCHEKTIIMKQSSENEICYSSTSSYSLNSLKNKDKLNDKP